MGRSAVGVMNGNWRNGAYLAYVRGLINDPNSRHAVINELQSLMESRAFHTFFNRVYDRYRNSDPETYERILRAKLAKVKRQK